MDCGEFGRDPRQLFLPNPRRASRVLTQRSEQPIAHPDRHDVLSMWVMTFGQAVDHDVQRTPQGEFRDCCSPENEDHIDCCQIDVNIFFPLTFKKNLKKNSNRNFINTDPST